MASQRVALDPLQGDDGVAASGRPGGAQRLAGEPVALPTATGRRRAEHVRAARRQDPLSGPCRVVAHRLE